MTNEEYARDLLETWYMSDSPVFQGRRADIETMIEALEKQIPI